MSLKLKPLQPFAAEASGIDLRQPLTRDQVRAIEDAMDQHAVLVFRNQPLTQHEQIAFAKSLGPLDLGLRKLKGGAHRFEYAELADISNVKVDGEVAGREHAKIVGNVANQLWHSDSSFQKPRAKYSMLSAVTVPGFGGETEFADLRMAYDALPEWRKKQVEGLEAERPAHRAQDPVRRRACLRSEGHDHRRRPHAGHGPAGARDPARVRPPPPLAGGRPGDVGQHGHRAPWPLVRLRGAARAAQGDD
jgi:alpha-ketoglutarate-dependent taurine dioxygenase